MSNINKQTLNPTPDYLYHCYLIATYFGLRSGELLPLKWNDIKLDINDSENKNYLMIKNHSEKESVSGGD